MSRKQISGPAHFRFPVEIHRLDWLEWFTLLVGFWFVLFPHPYRLLFSILLLIPLVGLALNGISKPSLASLVTIRKNESGKKRYDLADFIEFPGLFILIRVLIDYEFEDFFSLLLPGSIAFTFMLILLFTTHDLIEQSRFNKPTVYAIIILNVGIYSYAGTYGLNCTFDYSQPIVQEVQVIDKHIGRRRKGGKTHYLKVTPWGHRRDPENLRVSSEKYYLTEVGDYVKIDLKEGLFGIPWYYVE